MEFYIQIKDGEPFEHPIAGDNFRAAFPNIDVNNLPPNFAKFEKVELTVGPYEMFVRTPYFLETGVCKNGIKRPMTPDEQQQKIESEGVTTSQS